MALPKFSFSGWTSQTLAPKVNPASVPIAAPPGGFSTPANPVTVMGGGGPATAIRAPYVAPPAGAGTLIGTTNAANTNLPAWLQSEVDRINAQDAMRKAALGGGGGAPAPNQNVGDILQGVAAITAARTGYNAQINQLNEQARLQALIQQRNQLRPVGAFGFNNPMDVPRQIGLGQEIEGYRNVNLPAASRAVSGWAQPVWR